MNVLLVRNGPGNDRERAVLSRREIPLLHALQARGVTPMVVLCGDAGGLARDLERAAIRSRLIPTPLPPAAGALLNLPAAVAHLRALFRDRSPDLVEGDEPMPAIATGMAARLSRRPVIVYRRHHAEGPARLVAASRLAARLADRTIVTNEPMRRRSARDDRTPVARIEVAASGVADLRRVDPAEVAALRRDLRIPPDAAVVGVVSRLRHEKGIDVLLQALSGVRSERPFHAVIVGTGPEGARLGQIAATCPRPVHFVGHQDDVAPWFALCDLVTMPSRRESFGRVTLESMAAGRPLIASRVGGLVEAVVDGETGVLVPPEDADRLAEAIERLLANPGLARGMGAAARCRFSAQFTIAHMADAWRLAWERSLASGPGGNR